MRIVLFYAFFFTQEKTYKRKRKFFKVFDKGQALKFLPFPLFLSGCKIRVRKKYPTAQNKPPKKLNYFSHIETFQQPTSVQQTHRTTNNFQWQTRGQKYAKTVAVYCQRLLRNFQDNPHCRKDLRFLKNFFSHFVNFNCAFFNFKIILLGSLGLPL